MKVAIITMYYHNPNSGGLLQSYATYRILTKLGHDTKQICFDAYTGRTTQDKLAYAAKNEGIWYIPYKVVRAVYRKLQRKFVYGVLLPDFQQGVTMVERDMERFQQWIPHTKEVYTLKNISEVGECFDIYVAGSDQVWGQKAEWLDAYTLTFVAENRRKVAYAPSIARTGLTDEEITVLCDNVRDFDALSLREDRYQKRMEEKLGREVPVVLDPTMLLERSDWDEMLAAYPWDKAELGVCSFTEPYIFVYLLGGDPINQKRIEDFARARGLKIVYCPYVVAGNNHETIHWRGRGFGDYRIKHLSPVSFVKLIKNAKFVATDSFHACVFSILYHTEFAVLDRYVSTKGMDMSSRMDTLLGSLGIETKHIKASAQIEVKATDWVKVDEKLRKQREYSMNYLNNALAGGGGTVD